MLEVRFIEVTRSASRELGVQWNAFGNSALANIGDQACRLRSYRSRSRTARFSRRPHRHGAGGANVAGDRLADFAGGCRRCAFGLDPVRLPGRPIVEPAADRASMRSSRKASRAASPNPIWWRCRAIPRASLPAGDSDPEFRARPARRRSTTRTTASASRSRRPCFSDGLINLVIKPEVSEIDPTIRVTDRGHDRAGTHQAQRLDHARTARRPELHARRPVAEQQLHRAEPVAVGRRRAGARRAVPLQRLSEKRDRSGHHGHAARRSPAAADAMSSTRRSTTRCRERRRLLPDGQCRGQPAARRGSPPAR